MTPSEQPRLLLRKAAQDLAVLDKLIDDAAIDDETLGYHAQQAAEKLIKALLAHGGHDYPRSHNIGLLLDLLESHDIPLPVRFEDVQHSHRSAPSTAMTICPWMTPLSATAGRRCSTLSTPLWKRRSRWGQARALDLAGNAPALKAALCRQPGQTSCTAP